MKTAGKGLMLMISLDWINMEEVITFNSSFETFWKSTKKQFQEEKIYESIIGKSKCNAEFIDGTKYKTLHKKFGIYVFYIRPLKSYCFEELDEDWNIDGYSNYPQIIKSKFSSYEKIRTDQWYPFYIGKAEDLGKRINEHINHKDAIRTYGLKLKDRMFFTPQNIQYSYWKLPEELADSAKDIKQFLLRHLENELRGRMKPWIGRQ